LDLALTKMTAYEQVWQTSAMEVATHWQQFNK
jgi:hypothetical protein